MTTPTSPPIVLSIAGSDCSAGAGIQADLKTFTSFGCYGMTALTGVVAESPRKVVSLQLVDESIVYDQITVLAEEFKLAAVKTGMLGARPQIAAVVRAWQPLVGRGIPLVVDPVMVATSGGRLLEDDAVEVLTTGLFPFATLITPNLDEAAVLLGYPLRSREAMEKGARELHERYGCAVLVKGGHLPGGQTPDLLTADGITYDWLEGTRIPGVHTHGTGCTYSAAITAALAQGASLLEAVRQAKTYVTGTIAQHFHWQGIDALNHQVVHG